MIFDVAPGPIVYGGIFLIVFAIVAVIVLVVMAIILLVKNKRKK